MISLKAITLSLALIFVSALNTSAVPVIQETQCGGALTEYSQGGIFYSYNESLPGSGREVCIWTVVPGNNSDSINAIKFTMISSGFDADDDKENFVTIAYATEDGNLVRAHDYFQGDLSSVNVPSTVAFVIFTQEYYTPGTGFILYYEGIHSNDLDNIQTIPTGLRNNYSGRNGTFSTIGDTDIYQTFVFQNSGIVESYGSIGLIVHAFNIGNGPSGYLDVLNVWGVSRESPGMREKLLIKPLSTIYGSSSYYERGQSIDVVSEYGESIIAILRGGGSSEQYVWTSVELDWREH